MTIKIQMLPVGNGDCFVAEFEVDDGKIFRILVDGGPEDAYKNLRDYFSELDPRERYINLLVVTHIDEDHIGGVVCLLKDKELAVRVSEIWFNDKTKAERPDPVPPTEEYSVDDGNELAQLINDLNIKWNTTAGKGAICLDTSDKPVTYPLDKENPDITITVLSPGRAELRELAVKWTTYEEAAKDEPEKVSEDSRTEEYAQPEINWEALAGTKFHGDRSVTNLSSIAFLLKVKDAWAFFTGDAGVGVLKKALLQWPDRPRAVSVFKISHHGSLKNTDEELLRMLPAQDYLFSANGKHKHPSLETIARVVKFGTSGSTLHFSHDYRQQALEADDFIGFAMETKALTSSEKIIEISAKPIGSA